MKIEKKNFLKTIIKKKKEEIDCLQKKISLFELKNKISEIPKSQSSFRKMLQHPTDLTIIAEIKKASPSRGMIARNWNPMKIAHSYQKSGAQALSILTDKTYFQGDLSILKKISHATHLPCLRKDFIIDPYQIYESKLSGASAILLIVSILSQQQFQDLHDLSLTIGLDVLTEIHNEDDWKKIEKHPSITCIGMNSRNLDDFSVDLNRIFKLKKIISAKKKNCLWIAESGITTIQDLKKIKKSGFHSVLVGTALMEAENPEKKLKNWLKNVNSLEKTSSFS